MELGAGLLSRTWNALKSYTCYRPFTMVATLFYGEGATSLRRLSMIFRSPGPKVGWYSLLLGPCKIPKFSFVLWLAILEKLSTMDKPWLSHLGGVCVLCGRAVETHEHLFFWCSYSRRCIRVLKSIVRFSWPNRAWGRILLGLRRGIWADTQSRRLTEHYWQLLSIIFGRNVIKESLRILHGRVPRLLGMRLTRLDRRYLA
ncbi:hypothetical protein Sango_3068000 [Sesamum angolense]|uniref:Reverse transcriptase zinc-binding domain-containing protein n=1 Tax=Sesamum angolense TaxID=2727404 RepID=A0AAE1T986_9LAMI|nr:hypothetical protein Sango_3068000 [Sesamum angolense]